MQLSGAGSGRMSATPKFVMVSRVQEDGTRGQQSPRGESHGRVSGHGGRGVEVGVLVDVGGEGVSGVGVGVTVELSHSNTFS